MSTTFNFISRYFGNNSNSSSNRAKKRKSNRIAQIEELESREMLSATPWLGTDAYDSHFTYDNVLYCEYSQNTQPAEQAQGVCVALSDAEFASIRARYADLGLSANSENYNIIVIDADNLSDVALRDTIEQAAQNDLTESPEGTLVVVRTTATQNTITFTDGELAINVNAAIRGGVTIVSFGDSPLIIDADNKSRIFSIAQHTELALGGLTLTGGRIDAINEGGGAIWNAGTLTMTDSTITGNTATANTLGGGGIYNDSDAVLTISNSVITGNVSHSDGGGIYNADRAALTVINSVISGNRADNSGGGIYNVDFATLTIVRSMISGNSATWKGDIYNADTATLIIVHSVISEYSANYIGGNITHKERDVKERGGAPNAVYNTVSGRTVCDSGIYNVDAAVLFIAQSTISTTSSSNKANNVDYSGLAVTQAAVLESAFANDGDEIRNVGVLAANNSFVSDSGIKSASTEFIVYDAEGYNMGGLTLITCTIVGNFGAINKRGVSSTSNTTSAASKSSSVERNRHSSVTAGVAPGISNDSIIGLTTGKHYCVYALENGENDYFNSIYSLDVIDIPNVPPLSTPTGVTASIKNGTTLNIGWNAVPNASGYKIQCATDVFFTKNVRTYEIGEPTATTAGITDLATGTTYYFRLSAMGSDDYSDSQATKTLVGLFPLDFAMFGALACA